MHPPVDHDRRTGPDPGRLPKWEHLPPVFNEESQAVFRCGQCGSVRTAVTEVDHLKMVGAHRDAHALVARLHPVERDGLASVLRTVLPAANLCAELLAVIDRQAGEDAARPGGRG